MLEVSNRSKSDVCALSLPAPSEDEKASRFERGALCAAGAAVGAGIVRGFACPVCMQDHSPRMSHRIGIGFFQNLDIVPRRHQAFDHAFIKAGFQPEIGMA